MELNSIPQNKFNEDTIKTQLREIFEPDSYIVSRQSSPFSDIKTRLSEIIESIISPNESNILEQINDKFLDLDFGSEFLIDATKIGINDAIFFVNLLNQNGMVSYQVENNDLTVNDVNNKKINVTNSLINMLQTSLDTKKPIRLDFDNDVTVILKLDKKGKIQAHFIPGTSEVESYLKNNISCLRQNFDDEEIEYSYLGYSRYKDDRKNQQKQNKKRSNQ